MINLQMETTGMLTALKEAKKLSGAAMSDLFRWQMALMARDCMLFTQARRKSSYAAQFKKAKSGVAYDVKKVFSGYDTDVKHWPGRTPREQYTEVKWSNGAIYAVPQNLFFESASVGVMDAYHRPLFLETAGTQRNIQSPRGSFAPASPNTDSAEWTVSNRMHVPEADVESFIIARQNDIGKAKSGWLKAIRFFDGKAKPGWMGRDMTPRWVARHESIGFANGVVEDTMHDETMQGEVVSGNNVDYAFADLEIALSKRLADIDTFAPKRLQTIMDKLDGMKAA